MSGRGGGFMKDETEELTEEELRWESFLHNQFKEIYDDCALKIVPTIFGGVMVRQVWLDKHIPVRGL